MSFDYFRLLFLLDKLNVNAEIENKKREANDSLFLCLRYLIYLASNPKNNTVFIRTIFIFARDIGNQGDTFILTA